MSVLAVVVVEAHNHALEHIHDVLRKIISKRKRKGEDFSWTLVNYDSHPDMACMRSIPASAAFNPRRLFTVDDGNHQNNKSCQTLYEMLDTSASGIADWIIPLVLAADLKEIYWVRSSWARQFGDGHYSFCVGAWSTNRTHKVSSYVDLPDHARVKVSLSHPYYIEDSSVVPEDELELVQHLSFKVSQNLISNNEKLAEGELWCLSIDLDYFSCLNPFISDLEDIDKPFTASLLRAANGTRFRQRKAVLLSDELGRWYESEYQRFLSLVTSFFGEVSKINGSTGEVNYSSVSSKEILYKAEEIQELSQLYEYPEYGMQLWYDVIDSMLQIPMFQCTSRLLASSVIHALPCLFLPHHPESYSESEYQTRIKLMGDSIRQGKFSKQPPFMVAVSRSTVDGFTPKRAVDFLQDAVLREIHSIFCGCSRAIESPFIRSQSTIDACLCYIVFDYGEYEGSQIDTSKISF